MRKWTESDALDCLFLCEAEKTGPKTVYMKYGCNGLKACSAIDYLKKLNYTFKFSNTYRTRKNKKAGDTIAGFNIIVSKKLWYNVDMDAQRIA